MKYGWAKILFEYDNSSQLVFLIKSSLKANVVGLRAQLLCQRQRLFHVIISTDDCKYHTLLGSIC